MKVCTARQMAQIDRDTIAGGTPGLELMERAGAAMTDVLLDYLDEERIRGSVLVICGKGNNGGDGLVVARLLAEEDTEVTVLLLAAPRELSPDARSNHGRLPPQVRVVQAEPDAWPETFSDLAEDAAVIVDAVLGTGITPPLKEEFAELFRAVNDTGLPCVGLDIPSGVDGDDGRVDPVAVACDLTITVGLPKLGLLLPSGRDFTGEIAVVDIGFPEEICDRHAPEHHYLERDDYAALLPARPTHAHKYAFGKLALLAGSRRYGGAAHLAAMGALRSGVGLVTVAVPECLEIPLRSGLPEVLVRALGQTPGGAVAPLAPDLWQDLLAGQRALAVGPGLGDDPATDAWLVDVLQQVELPLVVDADGLGAWSRLGRQPRFAHSQVVLTPHPGELARLRGVTAAEIEADRFAAAGEAARAWGVTVMLKGSPSLIAVPDGRIFINPAGDDALARGGSGDVLTGLVGGLLAQGMPALPAALLGAYVHGQAGSLAATGLSSRSVLVREAAAAIGPVFESLEKTASGDAGLRELLWPVKDPGDPEHRA